MDSHSFTKTAALLFGNYPHYLDHLAPLASLLDLPLLVNEPSLYKDAKKYYPNLKVLYLDAREIIPSTIKQFDRLITCFPRLLFDAEFGIMQDLLQKKVKTLWLPHGNSDKGTKTSHLKAVKEDEVLLVYGKKMIDSFTDKKSSKKVIPVGNFRYQYFLQNKSFYTSCVANEITDHLEKNKSTILFAPTWNDQENSSSFFSSYRDLLDSLSEFNVLVKLHPNTRIHHKLEIENIIDSYQKRKNIFFLNEFPPIYPLLHIADIYIGDMSSIGYDFLTFDRPMFFLNPNNRDPKKDKGLFLFRCGSKIDAACLKDADSLIREALPYDKELSPIRKKVYASTFANKTEKLKEMIRHA